MRSRNLAIHRAHGVSIVTEIHCKQRALATGPTLESCREDLTSVIEEWILVRVARGLAIPPLGKAVVKVRRAFD